MNTPFSSSTRYSRVCSSIIEAILMALPTVESIAHTTFSASATIGGAEETPARLGGLCTRTCRPSSRHSRTHGAGVWWRRRAARPSFRRRDRSGSAPTAGGGSGRWSAPDQRLCRPTVPTNVQHRSVDHVGTCGRPGGSGPSCGPPTERRRLSALAVAGHNVVDTYVVVFASSMPGVWANRIERRLEA